MSAARRAFTAPPDDQRCQADRKSLRDGGGARCMRRAAGGERFCAQHAAMRARFNCEWCGPGNDESPPDHTEDCRRPR